MSSRNSGERSLYLILQKFHSTFGEFTQSRVANHKILCKEGLSESELAYSQSVDERLGDSLKSSLKSLWFEKTFANCVCLPLAL
jgi:hypothetical protein